ncbi:MAG: hypothetical protein ABL878_14360 [Burkholderiales bacterium]
MMEAVLGLSRVVPVSVSALHTEADAGGNPALLNGRVAGKQIFEKIIRHLDHQQSEIVLPLDFQGITFLDISCADEIICRLVARIKARELGGKFIILMNVDDTVRENVEAALKEKKLCCLIDEGDKTRICGVISDELRETYDLAVRKSTITTSQLQDWVSNLKLNAASNRLVRLEEMGLLYKVGAERSGRIFTYQAVA